MTVTCGGVLCTHPWPPLQLAAHAPFPTISLVFKPSHYTYSNHTCCLYGLPLMMLGLCAPESLGGQAKEECIVRGASRPGCDSGPCWKPWLLPYHESRLLPLLITSHVEWPTNCINCLFHAYLGQKQA